MGRIEDRFVSAETAQQLMRLGYNGGADYWWYKFSTGSMTLLPISPMEGEELETVPAPRVEDVRRWLRDVMRISVETRVIMSASHLVMDGLWIVRVCGWDKGIMDYDAEGVYVYKSYELAVKSGVSVMVQLLDAGADLNKEDIEDEIRKYFDREDV
jgi:hypothetical protein